MLPTTFLITLQQPIACILLSAQHLVFHLHTYQGSPQIGPASGRERPACLGLGIKGASSLFPNLVHPALYHKAFRIGYLFHPLSSKKNSDVIESWTWLSWMSKVHFPLGGILSGSLWVSPAVCCCGFRKISQTCCKTLRLLKNHDSRRLLQCI